MSEPGEHKSRMRETGAGATNTGDIDGDGGGRDGFDAFISYAHDDAAWVKVLAGRLDREGLRVFLDEQQILAGDVIVEKLDQGIRGSRTGVVVFSPASLASGWAQNEYAALMTRAINGAARFIAVLYGEVPLPPLTAARRVVDFRTAAGDVFDARIAELADAIRGQARHTETSTRPPDEPVRPEGALSALLRITPEQVTFSPGEPSRDGDASGRSEVAHRPAGVRHRLVDLWARLQNHRIGGETLTKTTATDTGRHVLLTDIGTELGTRFLTGAAGESLAAVMVRAEHLGEQLHLGLEIDDGLAALPWESLILPGHTQPLALHPRVRMFRRVPDAGTAPMPQVPGPLRILVAVASPPGPHGGALLDYEAELARILDAVDPARRQAGAYVRILNDGTLAAIWDALQQERFHILHISCHAKPGALVLETEQGERDDVTTARFIQEALPAGRGVPLIVLSGCSTALPVPIAKSADLDDSGGAAVAGEIETGTDLEEPATPGNQPGEAAGEVALGGLARGLCAAGVPSVLAMTAPVTDTYATTLAANLYRELALRQIPEALPAFCDARRRLELERRSLPPGDPRTALAEWATPAFFLRGPSLPLYTPGNVQPVRQPADPHLPEVPLRPVGDFVGRRTELRTLSAELRAARPGVLLHGIGGVGKSSLAAELLRRADTQTGVLASQVSQTSSDQILDSLGLTPGRLRRCEPEASRRTNPATTTPLDRPPASPRPAALPDSGDPAPGQLRRQPRPHR